MLIKMLLGNRKTEAEFKKYITRVACSLLSLGVWDCLLFALTVLVIML